MNSTENIRGSKINGHSYPSDYITEKFPALLKKHGMPHIRLHELRYSCGRENKKEKSQNPYSSRTSRGPPTNFKSELLISSKDILVSPSL